MRTELPGFRIGRSSRSCRSTPAMCAASPNQRGIPSGLATCWPPARPAPGQLVLVTASSREFERAEGLICEDRTLSAASPMAWWPPTSFSRLGLHLPAPPVTGVGTLPSRARDIDPA